MCIVWQCVKCNYYEFFMTAYEECGLKVIMWWKYFSIYEEFIPFFSKEKRSKLFICKKCLTERVGYKLERYRKSLQVLVLGSALGRWFMHLINFSMCIQNTIWEMKIDLWKGRGIWLKPRIEREKQTHIRKAGKKTSQVVQALAICRHNALSQAHIQTDVCTHMLDLSQFCLYSAVLLGPSSPGL